MHAIDVTCFAYFGVYASSEAGPGQYNQQPVRVIYFNETLRSIPNTTDITLLYNPTSLPKILYHRNL